MFDCCLQLIIISTNFNTCIEMYVCVDRGKKNKTRVGIECFDAFSLYGVYVTI